MPEHVVVGAGVYGAAVALALARHGREVLVLEAAEVAGGASGGVGLRGVRAHGRDPRELPLARRALDLWPALADDMGEPTGWRRTGHLQLIERDGDLEVAVGQVEEQRRQGIPSELLDGSELRAIEPELSERVVAAVHCPLDGVADHTATTTGLVRAAAREGAEVRERTRVAQVRVSGGRAAGVITDAGEEIVIGRGLVLLCNTGVAALLAPLGLVLPVFPVLPQTLVTPPLEHNPVRHLIGHAHRRLAMKALPGGEVMITGGWLGRTDPTTGRPVVDPAQVEANLAEAVAVYPSLEAVPVALAVADRAEAATIDLVPVIDRVPGAGNVLFATGWTGHGWAIAPAVSELLAAWELSGERPALLAPLSIDRFRAR